MTTIMFQPWIGDHYRDGFDGRRVLVLGESHYHDAGDSIDGDPEFSIKVVRRQFNGSGTSYAFFTKIARSLLGPDRPLVTKDDKSAFWQQVAFYNYVQRSVGQLSDRPTQAHWNESEAAFFEVLNRLKPDVVIAFGYGLWENLPNLWFEGPQIPDATRPRTRIYLHSGGSALTYSTRHPSRAFNPEEWHGRLKQVLALPPLPSVTAPLYVQTDPDEGILIRVPKGYELGRDFKVDATGLKLLTDDGAGLEVDWAIEPDVHIRHREVSLDGESGYEFWFWIEGTVSCYPMVLDALVDPGVAKILRVSLTPLDANKWRQASTNFQELITPEVSVARR